MSKKAERVVKFNATPWSTTVRIVHIHTNTMECVMIEIGCIVMKNGKKRHTEQHKKTDPIGQMQEVFE